VKQKEAVFTDVRCGRKKDSRAVWEARILPYLGLGMNKKDPIYMWPWFVHLPTNDAIREYT
jgi:hypothetical protein